MCTDSFVLRPGTVPLLLPASMTFPPLFVLIRLGILPFIIISQVRGIVKALILFRTFRAQFFHHSSAARKYSNGFLFLHLTCRLLNIKARELWKSLPLCAGHREGLSQAESPSLRSIGYMGFCTARTGYPDLFVHPTVETRTALGQFTPSRNKFRFAIETRRTRGTGFEQSLTEKCAVHIVRVPYVEF